MTMPLNVLDVPADVAAAKLATYRAAYRVEQRREYRELARGFAHIKAGRQVISLRETIAAGGLDAAGRPRLAVVRAGSRRCWLRLHDGEVEFSDWQQVLWNVRRRSAMSDHTVRVTVAGTRYSTRLHEAVVPGVPPDLIPRRGRGVRRLESFHVLWEADWRPTVAPRDPALLSHLMGDLWVVWAVWDLTELERAVLVS